jgi:hypothetical protein
MRTASHQKKTKPPQTRQLSLFCGDLLSECEFHGGWFLPEVIKLQMSMIELALEEINDRRKSQEMRLEAWDWLMNDTDWLFSSRECAQNNQLDIDELRRLVKRMNITI